MDFTIPAEVQAHLDALHEFIERGTRPLERQDDNICFFDHRREWARTDRENGGVPRQDREELLVEIRRRADTVLVPTDAPGFSVDFFWWTFNMPTDHAEVTLLDVRVGADAVFGRVDHGLELAQPFVHQNRIRQAAASLGAAQYYINEAVPYAKTRVSGGRSWRPTRPSEFLLVELHTDVTALRLLVRATAAELDKRNRMEVTHRVAMRNFRASRLACDAADRAMQTCGGVGCSRHLPFEHIGHHRRYRITEGSEEIQMRKVGQYSFGFSRS